MIKRIDFKWGNSQYNDYIILENTEDVWLYIEVNSKEKDLEELHRVLDSYMEEDLGRNCFIEYVKHHPSNSNVVNLAVLYTGIQPEIFLNLENYISNLIDDKYKSFVKFSQQGNVILINKRGGWFYLKKEDMVDVKVTEELIRYDDEKKLRKREQAFEVEEKLYEDKLVSVEQALINMKDWTGEIEFVQTEDGKIYVGGKSDKTYNHDRICEKYNLNPDKCLKLAYNNDKEHYCYNDFGINGYGCLQFTRITELVRSI